MRHLKILIPIILFSVFSLHVIAQDNNSFHLCQPQKGEGLTSFLIRNKITTQELKDKFFALNKDFLRKDNALILGREYKIPNTEIYLKEPLYGKEREVFKKESNVLSGAVYYLVSGHGGPDPGAIGSYGGKQVSEDEYAYDITLRLTKKLQENGATVKMIIQDENDGIRDDVYLPLDKDETCMGEPIPLEQIDRLKQRTDAINKLYIKNKPAYQRCVVIHIDSRSKGKMIDVFFYHSPKSKSGKKTANELLKVFDDKYKHHQPTRGYSGVVSSRNLFLLRKTYPTAVFIELGNIRNYRDQQRFVIENNRQALANWLYEGLLQDFKTNNMQPTLLVLAAGMGSRYGGLKQLDELGPNGESIIDYSVYDAIQAGFTKVVFVIRHSFAEQFKERFDPKLNGKIDVEYVYQELDYLPEGFDVPEGREKPWGTGHAMLMAKDAIKGPFTIINADDFYGREAYQTAVDFMKSSSEEDEYAMVGYSLDNTLSEYGTVSRGVCETDQNNKLVNIIERTKIGYLNNDIVYWEDDDTTKLSGKEPVSMNFWIFKNSFFKALEDGFLSFLKERGNELKSEFYFNALVDKMIKSNTASTNVLSSDAKWFGVTYKEDKPIVYKKLSSLIEKGVYPAQLWKF